MNVTRTTIPIRTPDGKLHGVWALILATKCMYLTQDREHFLDWFESNNISVYRKPLDISTSVLCRLGSKDSQRRVAMEDCWLVLWREVTSFTPDHLIWENIELAIDKFAKFQLELQIRSPLKSTDFKTP